MEHLPPYHVIGQFSHEGRRRAQSRRFDVQDLRRHQGGVHASHCGEVNGGEDARHAAGQVVEHHHGKAGHVYVPQSVRPALADGLVLF